MARLTNQKSDNIRPACKKCGYQEEKLAGKKKKAKIRKKSKKIKRRYILRKSRISSTTSDSSSSEESPRCKNVDQKISNQRNEKKPASSREQPKTQKCRSKNIYDSNHCNPVSDESHTSATSIFRKLKKKDISKLKQKRHSAVLSSTSSESDDNPLQNSADPNVRSHESDHYNSITNQPNAPSTSKSNEEIVELLRNIDRNIAKLLQSHKSDHYNSITNQPKASSTSKSTDEIIQETCKIDRDIVKLEHSPESDHYNPISDEPNEPSTSKSKEVIQETCKIDRDIVKLQQRYQQRGSFKNKSSPKYKKKYKFNHHSPKIRRRILKVYSSSSDTDSNTGSVHKRYRSRSPRSDSSDSSCPIYKTWL